MIRSFFKYLSFYLFFLFAFIFFQIPLFCMGDTLLSPNEWKLSARNVELFRKNNNVGVQQIVEVEFVKWLEIPLESESPITIIGLTAKGELYQLVDYKDRKIMRLLSGLNVIDNFYLNHDGVLIGVDKNKTIYVFDHSVWFNSPVKKLAIEGMKVWSISAAVLLLSTAIINPSAIMDNTFLVVLFDGMAMGTLAVSTVLLQLMRFDFLNSIPDGLRVTSFKFKGPEALNNLLRNEANFLNLGQFGLSVWAPACASVLSPKLPSGATESVSL